MRDVARFRQTVGESGGKALTASQARKLVEQARQLVRHGTGFTSATVAVLDVLVFKFANRSTGACFPSLATIADAARVSVDTVKRAITALEKAGLLKRAQRFAVWLVQGIAVRVRTSNSYSFADPDAAPGATAGEGRGVSAKCAPNPIGFDINKVSSLRMGLKRQLNVAMGWLSKAEEHTRQSVAMQLLLLKGGLG